MKRKDVLKYVQEKRETSLDELRREFHLHSKSDQKRLFHILDDLIMENKVVLSGERLIFQDSSSKKQDRVRSRKEKTDEKSKKHQRSPLRENGRRKNFDASEDFEYILAVHHIRNEFPPKALAQAEAIPLEISQKELALREDLREKMVFTIDGPDAKDLDDAVSIEPMENGWRLGVHIADVSYYVPRHTPLDKEALKRGNSFYFINRVVPMFPERLSNGICSLNPGEDRLTMSVFMDVDRQGNVKSYRIVPSVIHSQYRLTYPEVEKILQGKTVAEDPLLQKSLLEMKELFRILYEKRLREGSIDFDFREQKCELNEWDEPVKFWLKDRLDAERLIEEFMLLANQSVARFLSEKTEYAMYRVHEEPSEEKMRSFLAMALRFGHKFRTHTLPPPQELQRLLEEVKDKPYKELLNQMLLRSMQQARYQNENLGHYGLGFEYYTHFTSPIRRYADLTVHRLVKTHLGIAKISYTEKELATIANHISSQERIAMDAEREFYKLKAVRYMQGKEGMVFDGVISGVTSFGIFVSVRDTGIEGMVRLADLPEYFIYRAESHSVVGAKSKKIYQMGQSVRVRLVRANVKKQHLDFEIVEDEV
ncbi:ribonuclease R [Thermospira aquatica]|uniref:Ribonuclease R n=1 Tax=Thermospira aquatica TaxID=2828656 RepID=A0AAX3BBA9_9SPIR|nr:ribonuclease R [Thermospira aquatica]URA09469.1 ribonuclease R [Thermospira aquatica]